MKIKDALIVLVAMILAVSGCQKSGSRDLNGAEQQEDSMVSQEASANEQESSISDQEEVEQEEDTMLTEKTTFHTEEIWCQNGSNDIYGVAYIPDSEKEKYPIVIFSHELGNDHTSGERYAERSAATRVMERTRRCQF